jgi:hypothetical protein
MTLEEDCPICMSTIDSSEKSLGCKHTCIEECREPVSLKSKRQQAFESMKQNFNRLVSKRQEFIRLRDLESTNFRDFEQNRRMTEHTESIDQFLEGTSKLLQSMDSMSQINQSIQDLFLENAECADLVFESTSLILQDIEAQYGAHPLHRSARFQLTPNRLDEIDGL